MQLHLEEVEKIPESRLVLGILIMPEDVQLLQLRKTEKECV